MANPGPQGRAASLIGVPLDRRHPLPARAVAACVGLSSLVVLSACSGKTDSVHLTTPGPSAESGIPLASNQAGKSLPTLTFTRFDGSSVDFKTLAGRPLVVNVWSETCVPCKEEMPAFQSVHQALGDQVAFVGIDNADDLDRAKAFAAKTGVTYDIWRDPGGDFVSAMKVAALPTTFFVSPSGKVLESVSKALTADDLTARIHRLYP